MIEAVVPLGSPGELAGGGVSPDALAAGGAQRVELGVVPCERVEIRAYPYRAIRGSDPLRDGAELGERDAAPITRERDLNGRFPAQSMASAISPGRAAWPRGGSRTRCTLAGTADPQP